MGTLKRFSKPRATIQHPNRPEISFTVEKPRPEEALEFNDQRSLFERRTVAIHPDTGEVLRDAQGNLETIVQSSNVPFSLIVGYLSKHVKDVQGLKDEQGEVPFDEGTAGVIFSELLKPEYMVTEMKDTKEIDPKTKEETIVAKPVRSLAVFWLTRVMHEEERYRPLAKTSTLRSVGDTEKPQTTAETVEN